VLVLPPYWLHAMEALGASAAPPGPSGSANGKTPSSTDKNAPLNGDGDGDGDDHEGSQLSPPDTEAAAAAAAPQAGPPSASLSWWVTAADFQHAEALYRVRLPLRPRWGLAERVTAVSRRPFSSWNRPIVTVIHLCHACSCPEILTVNTARQVFALLRATALQAGVGHASLSSALRSRYQALYKRRALPPSHLARHSAQPAAGGDEKKALGEKALGEKALGRIGINKPPVGLCGVGVSAGSTGTVLASSLDAVLDGLLADSHDSRPAAAAAASGGAGGRWEALMG
jgi:hypothetical protein